MLPAQVSNQNICVDMSLIQFYYDRVTKATHIRAFTLPPHCAPDEDCQRVLCLTHEGTISGRVTDIKLTKSSIDPTTGAAHVSLVDCYGRLDELRIICIDLTLPPTIPCAVDPLPINVDIRSFSLKQPRQGLMRSRHETWRPYVDASEDGYIRGFYRAKTKGKWGASPLENFHVLKFEVDTRHGAHAIRCGQMAPAKWQYEVDPAVDMTGTEIAFDGMRGRLCFSHPTRDHEIIVLDVE